MLSHSLYNVASTFGNDSKNTFEIFAFGFVLSAVHGGNHMVKHFVTFFSTGIIANLVPWM